MKLKAEPVIQGLPLLTNSSMSTLRSLIRSSSARISRLRPVRLSSCSSSDLAASEVEAALREWAHEPLTLAEAAVESGYSRSHLRRLLREGTIPSVEGGGDTRVLRAYLPRQPGHRVAGPLRSDPSSGVQFVRAVVGGG